MNTTTTNPTITAPKHVTSLATSGILVHVEVKTWTATKQDKEITDEVTESKNAVPNAGRFVKNLMANVTEHQSLIRNRAEWYNWIAANTYPWAGAWRYLPNARVPDFMQHFKDRLNETQTLVDKFIAVYQERVSNSAFTLGAAFKPTDYPSEQEVRSKCSVLLHTAEVPQGDFRNAISSAIAQDLHAHYVQQAERMKQAIVEAQRTQFIEVMQSIARGCDVRVVQDDAGNSKVRRGKLFEGTLEKALEYCETFRTFNLDDDPVLESARADLRRILEDKNIDTLRESDHVRTEVKTGVEDILSRFGMSI